MDGIRLGTCCKSRVLKIQLKTPWQLIRSLSDGAGTGVADPGGPGGIGGIGGGNGGGLGGGLGVGGSGGAAG